MEKRENWSPIYFLSALGAGGLSVSFYMYLMFLVPHKSAPLATFDYIYAAVIKGGWLSVVSVLSVVLVFVFAGKGHTQSNFQSVASTTLSKSFCKSNIILVSQLNCAN